MLNTLGFLNPITNELITYKIPQKVKMNSELFIQFMTDLANQIKQFTVVVLDNASWHKSKMTRAMFKQWQDKGLFLYFLPPRSPHLNLIETLWRKIKYEWLKPADYYSEKTLQKKLDHIFKHYGDLYNIDFSMNIFKTRFNW